MGRAHTNPILYTRMCQGKVTKLMTNIIAESLYAQCNADGNEYSLIDALVAYPKDNKAISLT